MQRTFEARIGTNRSSSSFTEENCPKKHRHDCPVIDIAYNVLHNRDNIEWKDAGHMVMIFDKEFVNGEPQFANIANKLMSVMQYACFSCPYKENTK